MRRLVALSSLSLLFQGGVAAPARAETAAPPPPVVSLSALPRLRRAWSAAGLTPIAWPNRETTPASEGVLFAASTGAERHLVALDIATGKERWRVSRPLPGEPQLELAKGMLLWTSGPSGETEALDLRTGKSLWTSKLCNFSGPPVDNGAIGFALCQGPWTTTTSAAGSSYSTQTTIFVAFDLATGRTLWRREGWHGPNVVVGARQVFVTATDKVVGLDPQTGKELQRIPMPPGPPPPWRQWSVVAADLGGQSMILLNGGGDGRLTNRLAAIRPPDGRELWSRPYPQGRFKDVRGATPRAGRLFEDGLRELAEVDVATGKTVLDCPLPRLHDVNSYPKRWRLMRGELVSIMDAGPQKPLVVVRCGAPPGKPALAQLPRPAPTAGARWQLAAAEDGVVVMRTTDELVGYRVFETDAPEDVALSPLERVRALLDRANTYPHYTAGGIAANRAVYDELRAVPNVGDHLMAVVAEGPTPRRERAIDAATALRVPGVVPLLLDEIFRAPPVPPALTEKQYLALRARGETEPLSDAYVQSLSRRADQIVLLAAMNDPKAAARLSPLLLARSTPEALGWWDWNTWGIWNEARYGLKAWDGASRATRRLHAQETSSDVGHSETLTTSVGRPESHAAIYRMLARLGRREDATRLEELDRATARTGGWTSICDADDAVKEPGPPRLWVDPWGLCRGIDVGPYRVTQSRNLLWLRQRGPNGALGPPALASDPGGDQCNDRRLMQKASQGAAGHLIVRGVLHDNHDAILADVDAAAVFADSDHDGLSDATEIAFGTDPKRADTDGDGVPDGRDPAPLAPPVTDAGAGQAAAEMLRYATLFLVGGPLTWQGDRATWGESPSAVGLLLHLPAKVEADDQACASARPRKPRGDDRPGGLRTPFPIASVQSLEVAGDRAKGRFVWSERGGQHARDLELARVQGKWRVVDDRPVQGSR